MKIKITKPEASKPVDIFKPGTIVEHEDGTLVFVGTDKALCFSQFKGYNINNPYKADNNKYACWDKKDFHLFEVKLELSN